MVLVGICGSLRGLSILAVPRPWRKLCSAVRDLACGAVGGLGGVSSLSLWPWILAALVQAGRQSSAREPSPPAPICSSQVQAGRIRPTPPGPTEGTCRPEHLGWPHVVSLWLCPPHHPPKPTLSLLSPLRLQRWEGQGWRDGQKQARGIFLA